MCKNICEACVKRDYISMFTLLCEKFHPDMESKESLTVHMNETKDTSTNQFRFIPCRVCMKTTEDAVLSDVDSYYVRFIFDVLLSASKQNSAPLVLITNVNGGRSERGGLAHLHVLNLSSENE